MNCHSKYIFRKVSKLDIKRKSVKTGSHEESKPSLEANKFRGSKPPIDYDQLSLMTQDKVIRMRSLAFKQLKFLRRCTPTSYWRIRLGIVSAPSYIRLSAINASA
jgi:hypothetical protein